MGRHAAINLMTLHTEPMRLFTSCLLCVCVIDNYRLLLWLVIILITIFTIDRRHKNNINTLVFATTSISCVWTSANESIAILSNNSETSPKSPKPKWKSNAAVPNRMSVWFVRHVGKSRNCSSTIASNEWLWHMKLYRNRAFSCQFSIKLWWFRVLNQVPGVTPNHCTDEEVATKFSHFPIQKWPKRSYWPHRMLSKDWHFTNALSIVPMFVNDIWQCCSDGICAMQLTNHNGHQNYSYDMVNEWMPWSGNNGHWAMLCIVNGRQIR